MNQIAEICVRHSYGFKDVLDNLDGIGSLHHAELPEEADEYVLRLPIEVRQGSVA